MAEVIEMKKNLDTLKIRAFEIRNQIDMLDNKKAQLVQEY